LRQALQETADRANAILSHDDCMVRYVVATFELVLTDQRVCESLPLRRNLGRRSMTKILALGVAIGVGFFCVAAAQSMPLAPLEQAQTSLTIPVAGGCGAGFHRGPNGGCRRNGYYGGTYYGGAAAPGVVVAPGVAVTVPGVVVAPVPACRRVCDAYGCRRVC
jgi:hypothetical protein